MIHCGKKSTLQLRCDAPTTVIIYSDYLHCLSQLHQLELYIQFWGVIFSVWHDEMVLLLPYAIQVFASFLDYFEAALSNIMLLCLLVFVLPLFISYSHYHYYCPDFVRVTTTFICLLPLHNE